MAVAQKPSVPAAKPVSSSREEFNALKKAFSISSWEMSPNAWADIQITYTAKSSEQQARAFLKAIELATPEM
jgi:hypothetical protein